jgi:N-acetylneuraminic acid mutarotase
MVLVSGFTGGFSKVTQKVYAYNTRDPQATWREMDDVPVEGFSHAGFAVDGLTMYICGAYVGPSPGPESKVCLKFTPAAPKGQQFVRLPDMPEGRGGGGLNHIKETNSLVYAAGATRSTQTIDSNRTFELDLDNLDAGWTRLQDIPYKANHVSFVTAYYQGKPRYYWAGGQLTWNEANGNQDDLVELDQATKTWIRRADMTLARGHASTSTVAYGCGFIMAGGAINGGTKTADISYYGIDTNSWTSIGKLPSAINTPACDIVRNVAGSDWIYCQTGNVGGKFSWRIKISLN